ASGPARPRRPSAAGAAAAPGPDVVDQPAIAGEAASRGEAAACGGFFWLDTTAVGRQRPPSAKDWPAGHGWPQARSGWPLTRLSSTTSGSSRGKLALTRSVKAFMARLVEVVQPPLISPS